MTHAEVGDRIIEVNGHRALQSPGGTVTWSPSPDTLASVYGSLDDAELVAAAADARVLSPSELPTD